MALTMNPRMKNVIKDLQAFVAERKNDSAHESDQSAATRHWRQYIKLVKDIDRSERQESAANP